MSIIFDTTEIARRMKLLDRNQQPETPIPTATAAGTVAQGGGGPFLVYFDSGSDALSPGAIGIICGLPFAGGPNILIVGHTDTVGSFIDNKILSERRAEAVQACLLRIGVPAHKTRIDSHGYGQPRIATPPQTDCQENRRCEIFVTP